MLLHLPRARPPALSCDNRTAFGFVRLAFTECVETVAQNRSTEIELQGATMSDVATRDDVARVSALFTRGAMDAPDLRGDSMVTKHLEKLQQEKEKQGFTKMQVLHPNIGPTVCAIALEETGWEADAADALLSRFEAENRERIALLLQVYLTMHVGGSSDVF